MTTKSDAEASRDPVPVGGHDPSMGKRAAMDGPTLRATLARLGADESTLHVGATILRPGEVVGPAGPTLPRLALDLSRSEHEPRDPSADLIGTARLGAGGMGMVHLATQRSLEREVAVKTPLAEDAGAARALVREARVMGGLEHPNIVPVHALGQDAEGRAVLVMKRVEGVSWRALLDDPEHTAWGPLLAGHGDRLRAHLEILMQVCHAISYAHSRGIVHRDIKPENVMIGAFGEVHLIDWGIALRQTERDVEPAAIVGTPGYAAPEMVRGDPRLVDERTDVYLLGGTLYEILTGRMPHAAETAIGALTSSLLGEIPPVEASLPADLARLAHVALTMDKDERPASAEAFRESLARYLATMEALTLVRAADHALETAESYISANGLGAPEVQRPLLEARFALTSARSMRPGDPEITARLASCVRRLVERELALRSPGGARTFLAELEGADDHLVARVDALDVELARERADAEEIRRAREENDLSRLLVPGSLMVVAAAALVILLFLGGFAGASGDSPERVILFELLVYAVVGLAILLGRRRILATLKSRRITLFGFVWFSYPLLLAPIAIVRGESTFDWATALVAGMLMAAVGAISLLPRLWATVPVHALAAAATTVWPDQFPLIFAVLHLFNGPIFAWSLYQSPNASTEVS